MRRAAPTVPVTQAGAGARWLPAPAEATVSLVPTLPVVPTVAARAAPRAMGSAQLRLRPKGATPELVAGRAVPAARAALVARRAVQALPGWVCSATPATRRDSWHARAVTRSSRWSAEGTASGR